MLTQLTVNNFAIVKFRARSATGDDLHHRGDRRGKSIAIDALGLYAWGARRSQHGAPGSDKTEVSARFLLEGNPAARAWLATNEL